MKKTAKLLSVLLCITILFSFPVCAKASTKTGSIFTSSKYTHQSQFDNCVISQGVDLSKHNGTVDFVKMKKAGVKYVILRAGYRGYGEKGSLCKDIKFEEYIKAAAKAKLNIGIYFYSQAITATEARAEAKYTYNIIKNYKSYITLPVAFDYEFAEVSDGRFDAAWSSGKLNKTKCTKIARAFCEKIKSLGFKPMIYANKSFLSEVLNGESLSKSYPIWLANYTTKTTYSGSFYIWQFSSTGKIDGVSGNVDANFLYSGQSLVPVANNFTVEPIPDQAYTGEEIMPDINVSYKGKTLKSAYDYYLEISNNTNIGTSTVKVTGLRSYSDVDITSCKFLIVPTKANTPEMTKREVNALSLKWEAHPDCNGYRVSYVKDGKLVTLTTVKETACRVTGLNAGSNYNIVVQAYKTVNGVNYYGIRSDELHTMTRPGRVTGVKTSSRTDTTLTLKWDAQPQSDKYVVYKYNANAKKYEIIGETAGGSRNKFKITNLKANTRYKFKVRAVKTNEFGKVMNATKSAAYGDYTSPKAPKIKSASSNAYKKITVKHTKIGYARGYQVRWSTTSSFKQNKKTKTFIGAKSVRNTVSTARSTESYYVKVRAYIIRKGKIYYSPWSEAEHVYTR